MKFIIKNQKGFSILQALVVGGILIGSSMTILQIATISQKSNDQLQKVLSEKEIKKNLSNFLSSKYECYKSLNGAISLNDSQQVVLNQSLAENSLRNSLQSSSHSINFENLDFRFRFPSAGEALSYPNSATSNSDTIYKRIPVVAETYYKKISSKKLIGMKSSGSQNDLNMSILAKFTRFNTTSPWRFVSCDGSNAKEVEELNVGAGDIAERKQKCEDFYGEFGADQKCQIHTKKANCLMVGGTFANGDCIFKSHDYIVNGLNIQKMIN
jgi:type II secretory pathway pseudopilin PulG